MNKKTLNNALWDIIRTEGVEVTNQNIDWLLERAWKSAEATDAPYAETSETQIEEMAKDISEKQSGGWVFIADSEYTTDIGNRELAKHLVINKGYRKDTDIAAEIFAEIEKLFFKNGVFIHIQSYNELKKKYTEGEG